MNVASGDSQTSPPGNTLPPLFRMAAIMGVKETVILHLRLGSDINATDEKGRSPLVLAAAKGHAEICQILLEAGADPTLRDAEGNDALSMAINNRQKEVEAILRLHIPLSPAELEQADSVSTISGIPHRLPIKVDARFSGNQASDLTLDDGVYDLSLWEEDTEPSPPPDDPSCLSSAKEIQERMSRHVPINTDEDWSEIDIELPEFSALRRRRALDEDVTWLIAAREIIVSGLRDGWVTEQQIANTVPTDEKDNQLPDAEFETSLRIVLGEIGIILDDVPDILSSPPPKENDEDDFHNDAEDHIADEAINFLGNLLSDVNDPLTLYYKDVGPANVLSREEEITLAHEIVEGTREAFEAIARSTFAVTEILEWAARIEDGDAPLQSMISASRDNADEQLAEQANLENDIDADDDKVEGDHDDENQVLQANYLPSAVSPDFLDMISSIRNLHAKMTVDKLSLEDSDLSKSLRDKIFSLGLSSKFVSGLWKIVKRSELDSEVLGIMASGLAKVRAAKQKFAESNFRLVLWVARKYSGLPYMDLVQEGNIGLLKAIDRFDPRYGAKFSTYATWWIRQSITRAIADNERIIRLPVHMMESLRKIESASNAVVALTGRAPAAEELANILDLSVSQVQRILAVPDDPISIDTFTDRGLPFAECIEDTIIPNPEEVIEQASLRNAIEETLKSLTKKEAEVIRLRFGVDADRDHTLEEIGQMYGVSRERIRQIEKIALRRLSHSSRTMKLCCFLDSAVPHEGLDL